MVSSNKNVRGSQRSNNAVAKLFEIAVATPALTFAQRKSAARLFELVVLAELLEEWKKSSQGGTVRLQTVISGVLTFAGAPASADRSVYSYFELVRGVKVIQEAWIGVQVTTLSWSYANRPTPIKRSGYHEIDVGFFKPNFGLLPNYIDLCGAFSCKHLAATKEHVREALGLRRETARLARKQRSSMQWLVPTIPADPPTPMYLVSSSPNVYQYEEPVWALGLYTAYVHYSY